MNEIIAIRNAIRKRREEDIAKNGDGGAQDWSDYRYRCGRIKGLDDALQIIRDVVKTLNDD